MSKNMKSNLELVQELLENRLDSLDEKMDLHNKHIVEMLGLIKEQTTKTNGRVTVVENDIKILTNVEALHSVNCPRIKDINAINYKIDKMNEENFIIKVWNKYPKQLITVLAVTVIFTLGTIVYTFYEVHKSIKSMKTELTSTP